MAKVYSGRVIIPGDRIQAYFEHLEAVEEERAPFKQHLEQLAEAFYLHEEARYSTRNARKHSLVVSMFIEFITGNTDVEDISEITRGMVNTHFRAWWRRKVWDRRTNDELKLSLKKFFIFLSTEKGITNPQVLKALS